MRNDNINLTTSQPISPFNALHDLKTMSSFCIKYVPNVTFPRDDLFAIVQMDRASTAGAGAPRTTVHVWCVYDGMKFVVLFDKKNISLAFRNRFV